MARALGVAAGVRIGGGARLEVEDGSGGPELGHKGQETGPDWAATSWGLGQMGGPMWDREEKKERPWQTGPKWFLRLKTKKKGIGLQN
jgi:hypothetical protein